MDKNSNVQRKVSLSFGKKLNRKRHHDSPLREVTSTAARCNDTVETNCANATVNLIDSPPLRSTPVLAEFSTPPPHHRRKSIISLDDSIDLSPRLLDASYSPSCLFSQTLAADSPEVNWRWNRRLAIDNNAALQLFTDKDQEMRERRKSVLSVKDNLRKLQDQELRRAQQIKAHEILAERCAKLHRQFEEVKVDEPKEQNQQVAEGVSTRRSTSTNATSFTSSSASESVTNSSSKLTSIKKTHEDLFSFKTKPIVSAITSSSKPAAATTVATTTSITEPAKSDLYDFFNDSDADNFLLAATQQWESEVISHTQQIQQNETKANTSSVSEADVSYRNDTNTVANTTPTSSNKDKRSSFYMKFLEDEDESFDEWFSVLDEAEREASQPKKPRTSLQRCKSMPDRTTTPSTSTNNTAPKNSVANGSTGVLGQNAATSATPTSSHFKRYASSHALSPVARSKLFCNRK